jgi:hypothetical protein
MAGSAWAYRPDAAMSRVPTSPIAGGIRCRIGFTGDQHSLVSSQQYVEYGIS